MSQLACGRGADQTARNTCLVPKPLKVPGGRSRLGWLKANPAQGNWPDGTELTAALAIMRKRRQSQISGYYDPIPDGGLAERPGSYIVADKFRPQWTCGAVPGPKPQTFTDRASWPGVGPSSGRVGQSRRRRCGRTALAR